MEMEFPLNISIHKKIGITRGDVRDGTSGTGVRVFSPRFQPAAGEKFF